jgi:hypothetical protein
MRARSLLGVAGALAAGVVATFFLDPDQGRRRRAIARDRLARGLRHASDSGQALAADLRNRSSGLVASARRRLSRTPVTDDVLAEPGVRGVVNQLEPHPRPGNVPGLQD